MASGRRHLVASECDDDDLRLAFGLNPDDPLPEIAEATRSVALEIGRDAIIEDVRDTAGNIVGQKIIGASTNEIN